MGKSASIVGFRFRHYERLFTQYLTELIDLYRNNRLMVRLDTKTINGKDLVGISSIIDAIEVCQFISIVSSLFLLNSIPALSLIIASTIGIESWQSDRLPSTIIDLY